MSLTTYLTKSEIQARREALARELVRRMVAKGVVKSGDEVAIRDILPKTDLGYTYEKWETASLPAYTYTAVVSQRLPANKMIGFYGVQDLAGGLDTGITAVIRFKIGPGAARVLDVWQIQKIESEKEKEGISEKDVIYENQEYMTVEFYNVATGVSNVALLGLVAEPKGEVVAHG
ncbi:MAG: hypothetical protein QXI49_05265 [Candidatus Methanomethylicaceae archaeon]